MEIWKRNESVRGHPDSLDTYDFVYNIQPRSHKPSLEMFLMYMKSMMIAKALQSRVLHQPMTILALLTLYQGVQVSGFTSRASHPLDYSTALYSTTASAYDHGILAGNVMHDVNGLICRQVTIDLSFGSDIESNIDNDGVSRSLSSMEVTVLEATADSQEILVNLALGEEIGSVDSNMRLSHEDPYGSVLWPAASAIARHLLDKVDDLKEKKVLEVGTGTGLVAITAAKAGADVLATDYEAVPLLLLDYAASTLNNEVILKNGGLVNTSLFDICDFDTPLPEADILVAADIMYEPKTGRAMARRVHEALGKGMRVLVGDSPGRAGRPAFLQELRTLLNDESLDFEEATGTSCIGPRHELICGKNSKSVSEGSTPKLLTVGVLDLQ